MSETNIFDTSASMVFEPHEVIDFPDGTDASFDDIRLRSIRLRPQRSRQGELHGVFSFTFTVGQVVASDASGEPHDLLEVEGWVNQTVKRVESETWIPWDRVPEIVDMFRQCQKAGYRLQILKDGNKQMSYADVTEWFDKNPKKNTLGRQNSNTWMSAEAARNTEMLPATFVGQIGDMQEGTTKSIYDGLDDLTLLIQNQLEKSQSDEGLTSDDKRTFQQLIGNVLGFHTDNEGEAWPNRIGINALTLDGTEYNFFFDRERTEVTDLDDIFSQATARIEEKDEKTDLNSLFGGN